MGKSSVVVVGAAAVGSAIARAELRTIVLIAAPNVSFLAKANY